jgi:phosphoserine phosphatase RsbU/P
VSEEQEPKPASVEEQPAEHVWEGDYRPASAAAPPPVRTHIDPPQAEFLFRFADTLNTTLDLKTLLERTSSLVRAVIDYKIFAILLINDRTHDLRMRFQIGHRPEIERLRIPIGHGVVGQAAQTREHRDWR